MMLGKEAPFDKRQCVLNLADELKLDKTVFARVFDFTADEEVWLESETNETFAIYLAQIEKIIDTVDKK